MGGQNVGEAKIHEVNFRKVRIFFLSIFFYKSLRYNIIFVIVFRLIAKLSLLNYFFMAKNNILTY